MEYIIPTSSAIVLAKQEYKPMNEIIKASRIEVFDNRKLQLTPAEVKASIREQYPDEEGGA